MSFVWKPSAETLGSPINIYGVACVALCIQSEEEMPGCGN